jgi:hypothetical protein
LHATTVAQVPRNIKARSCILNAPVPTSFHSSHVCCRFCLLLPDHTTAQPSSSAPPATRATRAFNSVNRNETVAAPTMWHGSKYRACSKSPGGLYFYATLAPGPPPPSLLPRGGLAAFSTLKQPDLREAKGRAPSPALSHLDVGVQWIRRRVEESLQGRD